MAKNNTLINKGQVYWLTGLSGSGKTTISEKVKNYFENLNSKFIILDGDEIRNTINNDLGFTASDRLENNRRIAHLAKLLSDSNLNVIVATISPFENIRILAKKIISDEKFNLIYLNSSIETCISRDVKGLYKKNITNFTGISMPFEVPINPDIIIDTDKISIEDSTTLLINYITIS